MQENGLTDMEEINKKIQEKWNPLLLEGARFGDLQKVRLAISNNADISQFDKNGWSPLVWACSGGHLEIILYLLDYGVLSTYNNSKYYQSNEIGVETLSSEIHKKNELKSPL